MGRLFLEYLDSEKLYACKKCLTHIVDGKQLVSKKFHGKTGKAYLFEKAYNLDLGPEKE